MVPGSLTAVYILPSTGVSKKFQYVGLVHFLPGAKKQGEKRQQKFDSSNSGLENCDNVPDAGAHPRAVFEKGLGVRCLVKYLALPNYSPGEWSLANIWPVQ